jgi:hypothetical protein
VLLATTVNPLAATLSLSGLLGYVFVYTLWLKRSTPQNIVIGGAAGAVPPLVAWAAVTGGLDGTPLYLFAIVFFWTPPHFWALSLLMKDEYARAGVPMLPVVRGERETRRQILLYTRAPVRGQPAAVLRGRVRATYLVASVLLGAVFIYGAARLMTRPSGARRSACTCSRSPTSRRCSPRWWPTSASRCPTRPSPARPRSSPAPAAPTGSASRSPACWQSAGRAWRSPRRATASTSAPPSSAQAERRSGPARPT